MRNQDLITTSADRGVLRIGINRPEKLNALTPAMYETLSAAMLSAEQDNRIRVMLLHGTRDCFTSGHDLKAFARNPPAGEDSPVFRFLRTLSLLQKPLVAEVSGPAIGIGTTLLLHCDLVYADETARLQLPFVSLALCPEAASSYLLPQLIGHQRAAELLLLGEAIAARKALELGLINQIFPAAELPGQVTARAEQLAEQPVNAVQLTKSLLKRQHRHHIADVMSTEGKLFLQLLSAPEAQAALANFMSKA